MSSRGVEKAGLSSEQIEAAERDYRDEIQSGSGSINYPDRIYRGVRTHPLLIIHLLMIEQPAGDLAKRYWEATREDSEPVVAYSISFPTTGIKESLVEYVVNTTWLRESYQDELGSDELDDDDD